ncbi:MAG: hypothetical protein CMO80_24925 [Verrucomicrobiales bacterium]|nr:hypothetical protein [Verrucomicrobiales bacterium]|tara:strand:- start:2382 stop:2780 length:399 start_codon:yes stop_codon:yes gene_type:complete
MRTTFTAALVVSFCLCGLASEPREIVWTSLFNGKDLKNWDGAPGLWRVENGVLVGETKSAHQLKHHSYLTWRGGVLNDFDFTRGNPTRPTAAGSEIASQLDIPFRSVQQASTEGRQPKVREFGWRNDALESG